MNQENHGQPTMLLYSPVVLSSYTFKNPERVLDFGRNPTGEPFGEGMLDFDHMCKRKTPSVCAMAWSLSRFCFLFFVLGVDGDFGRCKEWLVTVSRSFTVIYARL